MNLHVGAVLNEHWLPLLAFSQFPNFQREAKYSANLQ